MSLYDFTVPLLLRALHEQISFLKKGEKWCEDNNVDTSKLLEGKLAEDMKPLPFQIQRASDTAKGVASRLANQAHISLPDTEKTFPELYARLQRTIEILEGVKKSDFQGTDDPVTMKIASHELNFPTATKYVQNFVIPNFFFHQTAAYAILRNAGVPVGKGDYLGQETMTA